MAQNIDMLDSAEASPRQLFHERLGKELAWTLNEVESLFLSPQELEIARTLPVTKARLSRAHDWLKSAAYGTANIPDDVEEDLVTELADEFVHLYEQLLDLRDGIVPAQESASPTINEVCVMNAIVKKLEHLSTQGISKNEILAALAWIDTPKAMKLIRTVVSKGGDADTAANTLYSASSDESIELRSWLLERGAAIDVITTSLRYVDTPKSLEFRRALRARGVSANDVAESLCGANSKASLELREALLREGANLEAISTSLTDVSTPESMDFRERVFIDSASERPLLHSLDGIHGPRAMKVFRRACQKPENIKTVALGLETIQTPQSTHLRERVFAMGAPHDTLLNGLRGLDDARSMQLRRVVLYAGQEALSLVFYSLQDCKSEESMQFRLEMWETHREDSNVPDSLAWSLQGIDTPSATNLRRKLAEHRLYGPALYSLYDVSSDESIDMRMSLVSQGGSLDHAIESLRGIASPASLDLRTNVAVMHLDNPWMLKTIARSLVGVYTEEAFALRERFFASDPQLYFASLYDKDTRDRKRLVGQGIALAAKQIKPKIVGKRILPP